jgi:hypothetical protein
VQAATSRRCRRPTCPIPTASPKDDLDGDGQLTPDEWSGPEQNFERLDADGDGMLTKQEIIDDQTAALRERGGIP